jgi:dTDP-4-dehydrorhamnose 3,5-epimerase
MKRFRITDTPIMGLKIIERQRISDERGFLSRMFCSEELASVGWTKPIAQINHTLTRRPGAVRGLHLQIPPHAETKLVSCMSGEVWDVVVDLRRDSPTFLNYFGANLSAENGRALLIPEGLAQGFQTLAADCQLLSFTTCAYHPESESGIHSAEPRVGIRWPQPITELSARDQDLPLLSPDFQGFRL